MKILVIQQKMTGDVLLSTVICQAIKMKYPGATVHYLVYKSTIDVLVNNPFIDEIISFDNRVYRNFFSLLGFGKSLKKNKYDTVIDAYGKWEGIIPAWCCGAKKIIGKQKWYTKLFYTHTVPVPKGKPNEALNYRLALAAVLTGQTESIDFPKIYLTAKENDEGRQLLQCNISNHTPAVMISLLGSSKSKSLPSQAMAEMLDYIADQYPGVMLLNYLPSQASEAEDICNLCTSETRKKIIPGLYAKDLREFMKLLVHCRALIGNEGGSTNIAKALNVPTFSVFCPWIPKSMWDMLVDADKHIAVHLQDYLPNLFPSKIKSATIKKNYEQYYQKFTFTLFRERLQQFLKNIYPE